MEAAISRIENLNLELKDNYVVINNHFETSKPGIFACGDVIYKDIYQTTTAVGEASKVAYYVQDYLNTRK
jgi:thioredoxin reductase